MWKRDNVIQDVKAIGVATCAAHNATDEAAAWHENARDMMISAVQNMLLGTTARRDVPDSVGGKSGSRESHGGEWGSRRQKELRS